VLVALVPLAVILTTVVVVLVRARRRKRAPGSTRERSAFVILDGNLWEACAVDDVREPWARFTTEPIRGFCGVPVGRHRIRTTTPSGEATLDFIAHPGEVLAWRLDADHARWEPYELDPDLRSVLDGAPGSSRDVTGAFSKSPGWLVHLRTTLGIGAVRSGATFTRSPQEGVDRLRKRLAKLVSITESDAASDVDVLGEARAIGEAIVGRPLTRQEMRSLVVSARDSAARLASNGDSARAMRVLALGLAVLPGDPELMVTAGCALAERGEAEEALRILNLALERDRCLEPDDVARAMRVRLELRSRLGRVRV
jgi:hypothetical protein